MLEMLSEAHKNYTKVFKPKYYIEVIGVSNECHHNQKMLAEYPREKGIYR